MQMEMKEVPESAREAVLATLSAGWTLEKIFALVRKYGPVVWELLTELRELFGRKMETPTEQPADNPFQG